MNKYQTIIESGENETLEFKSAFNQDVIETAAAFANTRGGRIFIGLSDSGRVVGSKFGREALRDFVNRIANSTQPAVIADVERIQLPEGSVVLITVPEYPMKPVAVRGRCFRRSGSVTRQMTTAEMAELHLQSTGQSPDKRMVPGISVSDLDISLVKTYMTRAANTGRRSFGAHDDPLDTLRKLELTGSDGSVTLAALLCFGKNPQSPFGQAVIKAGRLRGDVKILDDRLIDGPLLLQVDDAVNFLKKHMQVEYVIGEGLERNDVWDYPLPALREALMNAVCHRDYGDLAEIQIKVFDGSLQIWSPGFLPFGVTVEDLFLPTHASKPRNRFIAQIFYDMGFIEKYGSGTGRILEECRKAGLSDPEFGNFSGGFRVLFQSDKHVTPQVPRKYPASTPQVQRLLRVCDGEMKREALMEALSLKDRNNFKQNYLDPALSAGMVEMTEPESRNSPSQKYRLTEQGKVFLEDEG